MSRETEEFVSAGIAQLSPAHQQVVRMFYLEDRSLKQMATSLRGLERVHDDTCVALSTTLSGHAARARTGGEARGLARVRVPVPTQGEPAEALPYLPEI